MDLLEEFRSYKSACNREANSLSIEIGVHVEPFYFSCAGVSDTEFHEIIYAARKKFLKVEGIFEYKILTVIDTPKDLIQVEARLTELMEKTIASRIAN